MLSKIILINNYILNLIFFRAALRFARLGDSGIMHAGEVFHENFPTSISTRSELVIQAIKLIPLVAGARAQLGI